MGVLVIARKTTRIKHEAPFPFDLQGFVVDSMPHIQRPPFVLISFFMSYPRLSAIF
jgi:hypothetical protein